MLQDDALTDVCLPVEMFRHGYCRVTVEDAAGGRAWSNPIHLAPPAATAAGT
ncbi:MULTISPECIES: hypothetical protein [unclassified Streptomyces]|uniref:hypothetical protein n=1 Tax=unclassified Streptomyces TaxID=2593676 RepID=UPI0037F2B886